MPTALLIPVEGEATVREVPETGPDLLALIQGAVGGDVQVIGLNSDGVGDPSSLYINENGKLENLPLNSNAMALLRATETLLFPGDFIAGPMVVLGSRGGDGNDYDVPQPVLDVYRAHVGPIA